MPKRGDRFLATSVVPGVESQEVIFEGIQEVGFADYPDFPLYTLTKQVHDHPIGSTFGRDTLEDFGYVLESEAP
jgi:hypothetical protein